MIKRSCIEEIRLRADLYDVISPYVSLKRTGKSYVGLSPFNDEKTPSFHVHPDKGFFKCFSSGLGGDVFRFLELKENLNFEEAVEYLAEKVQVELEYEGRGATGPEERSRARVLREINDEAMEFFHRAFKSQDPNGQAVRDYWISDRGFSLEVGEEWRIGFSPPDKGSLWMHLRGRGFSQANLEASGLFFERRHSRGDPLERFRGRLMIPVRDVQGRVCGFTARKLDQFTPPDDPTGQAKYVNSPDTPIFHKGRLLFAFDRARTVVGEDRPPLLVEGQLDAIRCHSVGVPEAVACQGSSVTLEQMIALRRFSAVLECLLDGDEAGVKAALRLFPLSLEAGLELRFFRLPEGKDPDDLLRERGADAIKDLRQKAIGAIGFFLSAHLPNGKRESVGKKQQVMEELFGQLKGCRSQILQNEYIREAARLTGLEYGAVLGDFQRFSRRRGRRKERGEDEIQAIGGNQLTSAEEDLLYVLLNQPNLRQPISEVFDCEWIKKASPAAQVLRRVLSELQHGIVEEHFDISYCHETAEERALLCHLQTLELRLEDPVETANEALCRIYRSFLDSRRTDLVREMNELGFEARERISALQEERRELRLMEKSFPYITAPEN